MSSPANQMNPGAKRKRSALARLPSSESGGRESRETSCTDMGVIKRKNIVKGNEGGLKYICDVCSADITSTVSEIHR